jgi:hypothetical protein
MIADITEILVPEDEDIALPDPGPHIDNLQKLLEETLNDLHTMGDTLIPNHSYIRGDDVDPITFCHISTLNMFSIPNERIKNLILVYLHHRHSKLTKHHKNRPSNRS